MGGGPWKDVLAQPSRSICPDEDEGDCRYDSKYASNKQVLKDLFALANAFQTCPPENYLGTKVKNAVITVPAYFNDSQRQVLTHTHSSMKKTLHVNHGTMSVFFLLVSEHEIKELPYCVPTCSSVS